jgi:hypothetical protein
MAAAVVIAWRAQNVRALWPGLAPALIVSWFAFKHAMVRQDGHAATFQVNFAVALLFLLVCAGTAPDRAWILALEKFSLIAGLIIVCARFPGMGSEIAARLELRKVGLTVAALHDWPAAWKSLAAANDAGRASLRLPDDFHRLVGNGSVDSVPWNIAQVEANGWKWQPRPVFQSYAACTPALDGIDAAHLESGRAADFVVMSFGATDRQHPFFETPLSWRALWDRYDLKLTGPNCLLLQHRDTSRFGASVRLSSSVAHWDQIMPVPASDGVLLMGADIQPSLWGKTETFALRQAAVFVEVTFASGAVRRWRAISRNLAEGFLIAPFPRDLQEIAALFVADRPGDLGNRVVAIRFHTDRPGQFRGTIPMVWSRLPDRPGGPSY